MTTTERDDGLSRLTKLRLDRADVELVERWKPTIELEGRAIVLVGRLQRLLNEDFRDGDFKRVLWSPLVVDGKYGEFTDAALRAVGLTDSTLGTELSAIVHTYRLAHDPKPESTLAGCNPHGDALAWDLDGARSELVALLEALRACELAGALMTHSRAFGGAQSRLLEECDRACEAYVAAWGKLQAAHKKQEAP